MADGVTRRAALAALASVVPARLATAQGFRAITVSLAEIPTAGGVIGGIVVRPEGVGPFPIVLVASEFGAEVQNLAPDACARLSKEGFLAVAPDLLAADPSDASVMQRLDETRDWAAQQGGDIARLGIVGFGPGGRAAWLYDAYSPALKAAIAWYGPMQGPTTPARPMTALDAASKLHAPLLGLYGKTDGTPQRVLLDAEAKAKQAGKTAEIVAYVGAGANFAVPGSASFDQAATLDGWQRTVKWLRANGVH